MTEHAARRPFATELPFSTPAGGRPSHTRSSQAREDEHGWWCWRRKWEDVSQEKQLPLCTPWQKAKSRSQPPILRGRVRAALSRRWEGILACTAAKSFAQCRGWTADQRATLEWTRPRCTKWCGISVSREAWCPRAQVVASGDCCCCC